MELNSLYTIVIQTEAEKEKYYQMLVELADTYDKSFKDDDGKESYFGSILPRVGNDEVTPKTEIHIAYSDDHGILGAAIYDVYGETKTNRYYNIYESVHLIYLFVNSKFRRMGIGSILLQQGLQTYHGSTIYIEIDKEDEEIMNFYKKNGVRILLTNYVQPPLQKDFGWCTCYYLCHIGEKPSDSRIWKFLVDFYKSVNALELEEGQNKLNEIGKTLGEGPIVVNE